MRYDDTTVPAADLEEIQRLYLDLLKGCLTRSTVGGEGYLPLTPEPGSIEHGVLRMIQRVLDLRKLKLVHNVPFDPAMRREGRDRPPEAETMIGRLRLDSLEAMVVDVVRRDVAGDLVETGSWRGGASIFMRAVLRTMKDERRCVWVCDSFQGLPKPDADTYPADRGDRHWEIDTFAVSEEVVRRNFAKYDLLDDRVRFLPGWFRDTLPNAPIQRISVLRLDGDMYQSTHEALSHLYSKVSPGGYVVVDDYAIAGCRQAVDDYRAEHRIDEPMHQIDWTGMYWRRRSPLQ